MQRVEPRQISLSAYRISLTKGPLMQGSVTDTKIVMLICRLPEWQRNDKIIPLHVM